MALDLAAARALLDLSEEQLRGRFQIDGGEVHADRSYEGLQHVTQYYNPKVFPARVYARDGRVHMVYVPSGPALEGLTPSGLAAQLGSEAAQMRSRAGKEFVHFVHAEQGVAYSGDDQEIIFLEVFPPRSLQTYLAEVYRAPGPFVL